MKFKIFLIGAIVVCLWTVNNVYLNKVSQSEKLLSSKEKELEILMRKYDATVIDYENSIDLEQIKKKLEAQGMKTTRDINYFKIQNNN